MVGVKKVDGAIVMALTGALLLAAPGVGFAKTLTISRKDTREQSMQESLTESWDVPGDATNAALTEEQLDIFQRATDSIVGSAYMPVAVLATQLVAGTNYAYLVQATQAYPDATPHWVIAVVYQDLQGNASVTCTNDFDLADIHVGVLESNGFVGAWEVMEAPKTPILDGMAKVAFDGACQDVEDVVFEPICLLGTQVAEDVNYKVLAVGTGRTRGLYALSIREDSVGKSGSIYAFERPDLGYYVTYQVEETAPATEASSEFVVIDSRTIARRK